MNGKALKIDYGNVPLLKRKEPTPLLAGDAPLLESQEETPRPKKQTQTLGFALVPEGKSGRKQSVEKMNTRLNKFVEEGWKVTKKFFSHKMCYAVLERTVHPVNCKCSECPKLPKVR